MRITRFSSTVLALLSVAVCLLPLRVAAVDPIGSVVAVQGHATAVGADGQERRLQLKSAIFLDDKLITGRSARLQVLFDDDSVITQGENGEMVVDRYVYSPKEKSSANCAMKFASGLFRVVTGKIATINPERFKVQTRMATIGIRGCEVGFLLDQEREDVYVLWLPTGKSILVERTSGAAGLPDAMGLNDMLTVFQAGTAVSIAEGARLSERAITSIEMTDFYRNLLIDSKAPPAKQTSEQSGTVPSVPDAAEVLNSGRAIEDEAEIRTLDTGGSASSSTTPDVQPGGGNAQPATRPASRPALTDWPPASDLPTTGPSPGDGPTTPPPTDTLPPTLPLPPSVVAQSSGSGWAWVIYSDGTMDNSYTPGYQMLDSDFQLLKATGVTLTGSGQASAYVTHSAGDQVVNGTCNLTVQAGALPNPTWSGQFNMQNGPDNSLNFNAGGTIGTAGQLLLGSVSGYGLMANATAHDSSTLTAQQLVNSFLVGPGGPTASGAHGHFFFAHGSVPDPKVNCTFGVNFP